MALGGPYTLLPCAHTLFLPPSRPSRELFVWSSFTKTTTLIYIGYHVPSETPALLNIRLARATSCEAPP